MNEMEEEVLANALGLLCERDGFYEAVARLDRWFGAYAPDYGSFAALEMSADDVCTACGLDADNYGIAVCNRIDDLAMSQD